MAHSKDRMESMIINAKRANLGESGLEFKPRALWNKHNLWDTGRTKETKDSKDSLESKGTQKNTTANCRISPENVAEVVRFIGFRDPFLQVSLTSFPLCNSLNVTLSHQEFVAQSLWCTQATKYGSIFNILSIESLTNSVDTVQTSQIITNHHKSSQHHLWCNLNHWKKLYAVRDSLHYPPYLHLPPKIHRRFQAPREWNPWTCKKVKNKHTRNLRLSFYGKTNIPFSWRPRPGDENVPRSTLGIHKEVHSEGRKSQEKLEEKDPIAEWWQSLTDIQSVWIQIWSPSVF